MTEAQIIPMTDLRKLAEAARDSAAHYVKFRGEENSRIADECGLRFRLEASPENILTLLDASAAKDAEIARLREALEPIVFLLKPEHEQLPGTTYITFGTRSFTLDHLRRAAAALKETSHG